MLAEIALLAVVPFLLAYGAANDLLTMLIPNRVSIALVGAFFVLAAGLGLGWHDVLLHAGAGLTALAVTFSLFALGLVGGGDAKLAAAAALWLGPEHLVEYLLMSSMFGGILTLAILVARAEPLPFALGRLPFAVRLHDAGTGVPYGIALSAAALAIMPDTPIWASLIAV